MKRSLSLVVSDGGEQGGGGDDGGPGMGRHKDVGTAGGLRGRAGPAPPAGPGRAVHQERHVSRTADGDTVRKAPGQSSSK